MIDKGAFSQVLKTGLYFTLSDDDRVLTGDLHWNLATQEFQIRGIPARNGVATTVCPPGEKGPVAIMMHARVQKKEARPNGQFIDVVFQQATVSGGMMAWLEEWYGDSSCFGMATHHWEIQPNLAWVKS